MSINVTNLTYSRHLSHHIFSPVSVCSLALLQTAAAVLGAYVRALDVRVVLLVVDDLRLEHRRFVLEIGLGQHNARQVGGDLPEAGVHLVASLGRDEEALEIVLLGKLLVLGHLDSAQVVQVACVLLRTSAAREVYVGKTTARTLVAHEAHVRHAVRVKGAPHESVPVLEVLKALVVGDVVHQQHRLNTTAAPRVSSWLQMPN